MWAGTISFHSNVLGPALVKPDECGGDLMPNGNRSIIFIFHSRLRLERGNDIGNSILAILFSF
jgi:hypothetical protein